jgi:BirA family biotin operon repressor/biotin-[acetyl-CoA-carboxylase] ligase
MSGNRIHLSVIDSTNSYTNALLSQNGIESWTVVFADFQKAGRGQRGKQWVVEPNKNLTFSVALATNVVVDKQFSISFMVVKSIIETLKDLGLHARFKWPNDILIGEKKIAGILIENQLFEGVINWSIIGIGLNVNQEKFEVFPWEATSVVKELSCDHLVISSLLEKIVAAMRVNWEVIMAKGGEWDQSFAMKHLYGLRQNVILRQGNREFEGVIIGLNPLGGLKIEIDGDEKTFYTGEVTIRRSAS